MKETIKTFFNSMLNAPSGTVSGLNINGHLYLWVEKDYQDYNNETVYIIELLTLDEDDVFSEIVKTYSKEESMLINEMNNIINDIIQMSL